MKKILLLSLILFNINTYAQDKLATNLTDYINSIIANNPKAKGNDDYVSPTEQALTNFENVILKIVNGDYSGAAGDASIIGYKLIEITDNSHSPSKVSYVLRSISTNYWGTFVFAKDPKRTKLIIQCPHPHHDYNTGKQGIYVFDKVEAYAYFVSGTHRCNSSVFSDCSGTTSACSGDGTYEPYKISDQAHNVNNTFQRATEVIETNLDEPIFLQLHGFAQGSSDPYLIMSNSTEKDPQGTDYLSLLKDALLVEDNVLTFKIAHFDKDWDRLTATTNTQGRYINGSSDPCGSSSAYNSARFIHIEQEKDRLRATETGWEKMANAVAAVFPEDAPTSVKEELKIVNDNLTVSCYPNPFNSSAKIIINTNKSQNVRVELYNVVGEQIKTIYNGNINPGSYKFDLEANDISSGIYFVRVVTGKEVSSLKILLLK